MIAGLEILNLHAQGGMAEVFRARGKGADGTEYQYAVKRILPEYTRDPEIKRMFIEESRVAACLVHPNVVRVYDLATSESEELFIVMEFLEGKDLSEVIEEADHKKKPLPIWFSIQVARDVLRSLSYVATEARDREGRPLGLIHRDISPHNIFVCFDGQVKLTDFGVAKVQESNVKTQAGVTKGKLGYMSPEQLMGSTLDHRSDLYNVGILLYESIVGKPLFGGGSTAEFLQAMVRGIVPPMPASAQAPPELEALIRRSLDRDRNKRPPTAADFERELEGIARQYNLIAQPAHIAHHLKELYGKLEPEKPIRPATAPQKLKSMMLAAVPAAASQVGEQQRLEQQRLDQQRLEQQRLAEQQQRLAEQQRAEQQRLEQQRVEQQRLEQQRLEQQRLAEQQRLEQLRLEQQRVEQQRLAEQQRVEQLRLEQARLAEQLRVDQLRLAEQQRFEQQAIQRQIDEAADQGWQAGTDVGSSPLDGPPPPPAAALPWAAPPAVAVQDEQATLIRSAAFSLPSIPSVPPSAPARPRIQVAVSTRMKSLDDQPAWPAPGRPAMADAPPPPSAPSASGFDMDDFPATAPVSPEMVAQALATPPPAERAEREQRRPATMAHGNARPLEQSAAVPRSNPAMPTPPPSLSGSAPPNAPPPAVEPPDQTRVETSPLLAASPPGAPARPTVQVGNSSVGVRSKKVVPLDDTRKR